MSIDLYRATVPVLAHYLRQLQTQLDKARLHLEARGADEGDEAALLARRLAPDMFGLAQQLRTAAGFAQRICAPLAGLEAPALAEAPGLAGAHRLIGQALDFIEGLDPQALRAAAGRRIRTRAGEAEFELAAEDFVQRYALPNFFFHLGMAYALMRQAGVPLGKPDFDGFHRYPPGFSFA
jgi:hypothetical protein